MNHITITSIYLPPSISGKWRFIGIPASSRNAMILVVTVNACVVDPPYHHIYLPHLLYLSHGVAYHDTGCFFWDPYFMVHEMSSPHIRRVGKMSSPIWQPGISNRWNGARFFIEKTPLLTRWSELAGPVWQPQPYSPQPVIPFPGAKRLGRLGPLRGGDGPHHPFEYPGS